MSNRHDVQLTYKDGKRELLIDGQKVRGVRSTKVVVDYNDIPHLFVELLPATVTVVSDSAALTTNQRVEQAVGRGNYDESTGLYEWYEELRTEPTLSDVIKRRPDVDSALRF